MNSSLVLVVNNATSFAHHIQKLGVKAYIIESKASIGQEAVLQACEAIYADMASIANSSMLHMLRELLQAVPKDCVRILDFNLKVLNTGSLHQIALSLKCCDLLKIDRLEFSAVCDMLGITSQHSFDNGFELMKRFNL